MIEIPLSLPKIVSGEFLEKACINAAKDIGFVAESEDKYLDQERKSIYETTTITVYHMKPIFRIFGHGIGKTKEAVIFVGGIKKNQSQEHVYLWSDFEFSQNSVPKETINNYIRALLKYI